MKTITQKTSLTRKTFDFWKNIPVSIRCTFWLFACTTLSWLALELFRPTGCFQTSHPYLLLGASPFYFGILCLVDQAWGWCISKSIGISCSAWHGNLPHHLARYAAEQSADKASDFLNRHSESITAALSAALGASNFLILVYAPICGPYGSMLLYFLLCIGLGVLISPITILPNALLIGFFRKRFTPSL